jgi:hypothetical protein
VGSSLLKPPSGSPVGGPRNSSGAPNQVGEGRRSVARNLPDRRPLAAAIVILGLTIFGVLMSVYPIAGFSSQSVDKPIIPIWEPADEEQPAGQTEDEHTPTPTLSSASAQFETSGATDTVIEPGASEVVEAALREPFVQEPKEADEAAESDDRPRAAFANPAGHPVDPVLPRVESPSSENIITSSQDPPLTSTAQYPDVTAQPLPPQISPPDSPVGTETFPQPPAPPDEMTSSPLPADSTPLRGDL